MPGKVAERRGLEPSAAGEPAPGELQEHPVPFPVPARGQQAQGEEHNVTWQTRHCDNTRCGQYSVFQLENSISDISELSVSSL